MKKLLYLTFLAFCALSFSFCKKDTEPEIIENHLPTLDAMKNANLTVGSRKDSMELSTGLIWNYHLTAPFSSSGQKFPLILALHWAGDEAVYEEYATCLVEPGFVNIPAYIFAPENFGDTWTSQYSTERLESFLDLAIEHWPIDTSKIVVTGYSLGGIASWEFARSHKQYFSASIPMAGSYANGFKTDIPTYVIHGENDDLFPLVFAEQYIMEANNKGSDITLVVADSLEHNQACDYVEYLKDAATWLQDDVW